SSNTKFSSIQNDEFKQQLNESSSIQNDAFKQLVYQTVVEKKIQDQDELNRKEISALTEKSEKNKDELIKQIIELTESNAKLSTTIEMLDEIYSLKLQNYAINPIRKTYNPIKRNFAQCNDIIVTNIEEAEK
ncbi:hypothetical protein RFI_27490, partial [Reticulomyxa filosa]